MSIELSLRGDVGLIALNDEARRNALSPSLVGAALDALAETRRRGARAVVLCSRASVFSAGADLSQIPRPGAAGGATPAVSPIDLFEALTKETRPVIAAVDGGAFGGGFELTLCCDAVVAGRGAYFVLPEIGHGVIPSTALMRLPALIGLQRARELILSRRRVPAIEAQQLGIVTAIVPGAASDGAVALAQSMVGGVPPGALAAAKADLEWRMACDWARVRSSRSRCNDAERAEGVTAFLEKRRPDYAPFWAASLSRDAGE